jgi:hypothetical protein
MTTAQAIATNTEAASLSTGTEVLSQKRLWTGRILTGLSSAFLIFDGSMKLLKPGPVLQASLRIGYPESALVGTGIVLLACTLLYLIRPTSVLGAVLLTGYLGGAVAINVRAEQPVFNVIFPILFAVMVWAGLALRESCLTHLVLLKQKP